MCGLTLAMEKAQDRKVTNGVGVYHESNELTEQFSPEAAHGPRNNYSVDC